jgi:hypothetical protein
MMRFRNYHIGFIGLFAILLSACSTTQIKSVWKDPSYSGYPQRIMVIGVAKEPINRRIAEDEFVLQLKAKGMDAIASYTTLPDRSQDDQAVIAKMVKELGVDTVLISRLVSKRNVRVYYPPAISHWPPYYGTWPEYYRYGYESLYTPGYITKYEYALVETNLYDAGNENLIWAVTTETGLDNLNQALIKNYVGSILNIMAEHGLFRAAR